MATKTLADSKAEIERLMTSEDKIVEARKFLRGFGIDEKEMSDSDVVVMVDRIHKAKEEQVQVLSRGQATDSMRRLLDKLPKNLVGEFKGNNELDIQMAQAIGWEVYKNLEVAKDSPTASTDSTVKIADSILMVMPIESYIALRMGKRERNQRNRMAHDPKNHAKNDPEARSLVAPVFSE